MDNSTVHSLFRQTMEREAAIFAKEIDVAATIQDQLLRCILWKNRDSEFGIHHGFDGIRSLDEYRRAVPLSSYEDYLPHIDTICDGKSKVLTSEPVLRFHLSSGTSSAFKYIPFTASLAQEFQAAIAPWLVRMYERFPRISEGRAYWALTPPLETKVRSHSALPIGFDSEESYFPPKAQKFLPYMLINAGLSLEAEPEDFFNLVLLHLIESEDLTWLSVWSPTYLLVLWENFLLFGERLIQDLHARCSRESTPTLRSTIQRVTIALADKRLDVLWPNLQLLSCWTDAWAAGFIEDVKRLFPNVPIERKGLMATEGVITIPWCAAGEELSPILAYRSHVFEFLDRISLQPYLPHELEPGKEYQVVITTSGGYYRYQLGDIVRCEGFEGAVPRLSFQGRAGVVSDLCGEKLNEYHVQCVLSCLYQEYSIPTRYHFLAPDLHTRRYILFIEPFDRSAFDILSSRRVDLLNALDTRLKENVHYSYCRKIGQLNEPDLVLLDEGFRSRLIQNKSKRARLGVLKTSSFGHNDNLSFLLGNDVREVSAYEN